MHFIQFPSQYVCFIHVSLSNCTSSTFTTLIVCFIHVSVSNCTHYPCFPLKLYSLSMFPSQSLRIGHVSSQIVHIIHVPSQIVCFLNVSFQYVSFNHASLSNCIFCIFSISYNSYTYWNTPIPNLPHNWPSEKVSVSLFSCQVQSLFFRSKLKCTVIQGGFSIVKFIKKVSETI